MSNQNTKNELCHLFACTCLHCYSAHFTYANQLMLPITSLLHTICTMQFHILHISVEVRLTAHFTVDNTNAVSKILYCSTYYIGLELTSRPFKKVCNLYSMNEILHHHVVTVM